MRKHGHFLQCVAGWLGRFAPPVVPAKKPSTFADTERVVRALVGPAEYDARKAGIPPMGINVEQIVEECRARFGAEFTTEQAEELKRRWAAAWPETAAHLEKLAAADKAIDDPSVHPFADATPQRRQPRRRPGLAAIMALAALGSPIHADVRRPK